MLSIAKRPPHMPQNGQKRVPRTKHWLCEKGSSPVPSTGVKKQCKRVSLSPHFLLQRAQNQNEVQKWSKILYCGMPKCFFSWHSRHGPHFEILFWSLQRVFFSQCLQNAWAALSDWPPWSCYLNAFWEIFGFCFATSHQLDALLTSLPGLGGCPAHQPDHQRTLPLLQPDWRRGSQGLVAAAGRVWRTIGIIQIQWIYFSGSTICNRDEFGTPQ